ncbi:PfaD family polyunsaturated fatty acid/polyketide biosynthesis protein [bacterium]|nr:PfaD family polyunsaturated fatty acid/polyketide biosynthesis protein [bacterium]
MVNSPSYDGNIDPIKAILRLTEPIFVIDEPCAYQGANLPYTVSNKIKDSVKILAFTPAILPQNLGSKSLKEDLGIKYPCISGSMANGIASEDLVVSMAKAGMMGFFGSAGLSLESVEAHIDSLKEKLGDLPHGFNLIHSPYDQDLESKLAELFIDKGVENLEASAFLTLTPPILHYRYSGIKRLPNGEIFSPHRVFAKVSRQEVAQKFLSPPPAEMLQTLVEQGKLTPEEAELAQYLPPAYALTAEADSGGHTDNRPALVLIPSIIELRNTMQKKYGWNVPVGAAGGVSTPQAANAMFSMGAAYIMTGTVNQACVESGSSDCVRDMLSKANSADVTMAPAADMFEMGVNVQVLKWGTMFPLRAKKLYEIYRTYPNYQAIPQEVREQIEKSILRAGFEEVWQSTAQFFMKRDPRQIDKANKDPKHKMALVFRSYLGQASRWANAGLPERKADYQIWCGPSIGSFNQWCKGTFLDSAKERHADLVNLNILAGACVLARVSLLQSQGLELPAELCQFSPRSYNDLVSILQES